MWSMKPLARSLPAVAVAALAVAAFLAPGRDADAAVPESAKEMGGIRLGMTMDEAKAAVAAHQPPMTIVGSTMAPVPGQSVKTFTAAVYANTYTHNRPLDFEAFEIFFPPPPAPSRVVGIRRVMGFSPEKAPTQEYLQTSLREKFGGPTTPGPDLSWVWKGGAHVAGADVKCTGDQTMSVGTYKLSPQSLSNRTGCGLVAVAVQRQLGTYARTVTIDIVDYDTLVDAISKAVTLEAAATKKKNDDDAAQAQKNRPKL
jgi:hypothetical protein